METKLKKKKLSFKIIQGDTGGSSLTSDVSECAIVIFSHKRVPGASVLSKCPQEPSLQVTWASSLSPYLLEFAGNKGLKVQNTITRGKS